MKKLILFIAILLLNSSSLFAQVGINNDGSTDWNNKNFTAYTRAARAF